MGKRHREARKVTKGILRRFGYYQTELGELRESISKAEARRRLLRRQEVRDGILATAMQRAREEIWAIEDARIFAELDKFFGPPGRPWWIRLDTVDG
jgi:hypothetical protein